MVATAGVFDLLGQGWRGGSGRSPRPGTAAAAALLAPALSVALAGCGGPAGATARRDLPPAAAPATPSRLVLSGELAAASSVDLFVPETPLWAVQLRALAEDGSSVRAGDVVAEFDSTSLASTLEDRRLALQEAETEVVRLKADREAAAHERGFVVEERRVAREKAALDAAVPVEIRSRRDHEEKQLALRKAEVELAKAEEDLAAALRAAEADAAVREIARRKAKEELDAAETAVAALSLRAPRDGVAVVADNPRERRKIQAGDSLWPGMAVVRLPDLATLQVDATLFDVDDGLVRPGQAVSVSPDAFPDRRLAGRVVAVTAVAQPLTNESTRMAFRVRVGIEGGPLDGLRPGMSAKVDVPLRGGAEGAETSAPPPPLLPDPSRARRAPVLREDLVVGVELKGTLGALDGEPIGPVRLPDVWEYRIAQMAPEGGTIKKGQPVLSFDTSSLAQRLAEQQADGERAGKQIERRRRDLDIRRKDLELRIAEAEGRERKFALKAEVPPDLAGAIEARKARLDLALAREEVVAMKQRLAAAERAAEAELSILESRKRRADGKVEALTASIARMTIPSPRDGTVLHIPNWRDEKRKVGDTCWFGEKVLEVPDLARLGVKAEVDEADAGRVTEGQRVVVRLDAHPDLEFTGRVKSVQKTVQRASPKLPLRVAKLDVVLDRVDTGRMRPGMRTRGRVEVDRARQALVVPLECLVPTSGGPSVFRRDGRAATLVRVTLGRRGEEKAEVLSGLREGDELLVPGGQG